MSRVALTGLLTIELPEATLRFTDGGFIEYGGETYRAKDDTFGTIQSVQPLSEGVGDSVPALSITLLPPDTSAVAELAKPGHQTAQVQFVLAEYDVDAGTINSADVLFTGQIDQSVLTVGKGKRELSMSVLSTPSSSPPVMPSSISRRMLTLEQRSRYLAEVSMFSSISHSDRSIMCEENRGTPAIARMWQADGRARQACSRVGR